MIIRKPYAFLIKNFKKIHILLFLLMLYVLYRTNNVSGFFNSYARSSTGFYESTLSRTYVNPLFYFGCLLIVLLSAVVLILMKQKEKPAKLYVSLTIMYTALIVLMYVDAGYLRTIIFEQLTPRTIRMIRDINFIAVLPQVGFLLIVFVRAIGFNIKKFNFGKDIEDLQIDVSDNEEFELTIGTDSGKFIRALRRNKRELSYFYLEHKSMIWGILTIIIMMISWSVYYNISVVNKIFNQDEITRFNNLSYKVDEVYSSNLNYRGEKTIEENNTFVILKMKFYNGNKEDRVINLDNMNVIINENIYLPIVRKYGEFKDLGIGYTDQKIKGDSEGSYLFMYKISNEDIDKRMVLRYTDRVWFTTSGIGNTYLRYYINPKKIDNISTFPIAELKKEVNYTISNLKNTKLTINNVEFNDKYSYKKGEFINIINDPMDNKKIMKISYSYVPDPSIKDISTFSKLLKEYGAIKYYKDNKVYTLRYVDLTPYNYNEPDLYFSVPSDVEKANKIELVISVRDLIYIHKLK